MSAKPLPLLSVGDRLHCKPSELEPHELCAPLPMHPRVVRSISASVPTRGIIAELLITPDRKIADGRHRWRGCIQAGLSTKAVLPVKVIDPTTVADVIVTSVAERYDLSVSAKLYMLVPMIEKAVAEGIAARSGTLKRGDSPANPLSGFSGKMGLEKLAEEMGCGLEMLRLARKTVQLFRDSDDRVRKWLQNHLEEAEAWEEWQSVNGDAASWQRWRDARLADMGHSPLDPKCAAIIPEDYREIYEAKLFSVEPGESMGLGAINKAVGSALATKGGQRSDLDKGNPAIHLTLAKKLDSFSKTMFAQWLDLELDHRLNLATGIAEAAMEWPDEVRAAVVAKLKQKGWR